ncbi:MAG: hypothetical protein AAFV78_01390 [Bacteroidota bacterium]
MKSSFILLGILFLLLCSAQAQYTAFYSEGMQFSVSGIPLKDLDSRFIAVQIRVNTENLEEAENMGRLFYMIINHADEKPCSLSKADSRIWNNRMCKSVRDHENRVVLFTNPLLVMEALDASGWEMISPIPEFSAFDSKSTFRDVGPGYLFKRK